MSDHETPPAGVQRQLRQEAGFGCCKCGYPFYQHHHIVPWETEHHYRPEDMMIVCPNCHNEITTGKVSADEQRQWKNSPRNIKDGHASGLLRIDQNELAVNLGGSAFVQTPTLLEMYGEPIIAARLSEDRRLLVSIVSYDEKDNLVFRIVDNEWVTGDNLPWDLDAKWRHATLRHKLRDIGLEVDARENPVKIRGTFWKAGRWFKATESVIHDQNNNRIMSMSVSHCQVGISYG